MWLTSAAQGWFPTISSSKLGSVLEDMDMRALCVRCCQAARAAQHTERHNPTRREGRQAQSLRGWRWAGRPPPPRHRNQLCALPVRLHARAVG